MKKIWLMMFLSLSLMAWDEAKVVRIVDGDTVVLKHCCDTFKARIIGIDTPESSYNKKLYKQANQCGLKPNEILRLGKMAKGYTQRHLKKGSKILFLEAGVDFYGRHLVWIKGFNFQIIKDGIAQVYKHAQIDYKTKKTLFAIEKRAKEDKKGIWKYLSKDCL